MTDKQEKNNTEEKKLVGFARDENKKFINKNGRPPKGTAISDIMREYLDGIEDDKTRKEILVEKIFNLAKSGDLAAIKQIIDRLEGTPTNKHEIDSTSDMNVNIKIEGK